MGIRIRALISQVETRPKFIFVFTYVFCSWLASIAVNATVSNAIKADDHRGQMSWQDAFEGII